MLKISTAEKLEALVRKAVEGGFMEGAIKFQIIGKHILFAMSEISAHDYTINDLVFDKDFARALFGEEIVSAKCACGASRKGSHIAIGLHGIAYEKRGWRHSLQQAVIADDPIGYMYKAAFPSEVNAQKPS